MKLKSFWTLHVEIGVDGRHEINNELEMANQRHSHSAEEHVKKREICKQQTFKQQTSLPRRK